MKPAPNSVFIRRMTIADLPQVMAIAASLPHAPHWPHSAYIAALNPEAPPHRIALVIVGSRKQASGVQAFAIASLLAPQAELESIAVAIGRQRQGLAGQLFRALTAELRSAGAKELVLEVRASNQPATAFYRSLGFAETARRTRYYNDPIEDAVLMNLQIK